ncbi:protein UPSTREAM OF FLC [Quillaja saponaria]|uniref:Protein UPSTREAM OF FLC n=1 Tax=Quillaja saponaria TaxID=32244 RepID=A0AAD7KTC5_QUISA|nr:protein UPSTREAM OF FLC [Quillaja saponaria]
MDVRSRRARETSPERVKTNRLQQRVKPIKKVQVVYYLSRNGHLEHPHYIEVTHLTNQPLRLKDVLDRLIALRGKGMPAQYSWSCKKSYKNGYVWCDLAENDIIYPAEGAEFVLKGSELFDGCSEKDTENTFAEPKFHRRMIQHEPKFNLKSKPLITSSPHREPELEYEENEDHEEEEAEELDDKDGEKRSSSYASSTTTPHSGCSRGVSTDDLEEEDHESPPKTHKNSTFNQPSTTVNDSPPPPPPPSTSTSSVSVPGKQNQINAKNDDENHNSSSKRFQGGDPFDQTVSAPSRNSVLLQLIACGKPAVAKVKNSPCMNSPNLVKKSESLHRGVVYKSAVANADSDMINYMSEDPRFGNLQSEEKEYFSGSFVDSMSEKRVEPVPVLKKSNSCNEESKLGLGEAEAIEKNMNEKREKVGVVGKCIPRMKSAVLSSSSSSLSSSKRRGK